MPKQPAAIKETMTNLFVQKESKLGLRRHFTKEGVSPFDEVAWRKVKVTVRSNNGKSEDRELEFPEFWSDNAAHIAGSKYFRGRVGSPERESSARQMIGRVADTMAEWGLKGGYFDSEDEAQIFRDELTYIVLHQYAAFNSPVWFNVGVSKKPQCSACFILSVEDSMSSILDWIHTEGMIFKRGSGAGINLSPLRSCKETLSEGGHASGPVSFMRGADSVAGMIAAGGSTRRAAKMVILNIDHPDIEEFVRAKADEEKVIRALIQSGYNMYDINNPTWRSIQFQNANNSVRVTDEFMHAVESGEKFSTTLIQSSVISKEYNARELMHSISEAAWECGDPGMQYDTTINKWHTCPNSGRINASNPCSEYMHIDNSACNLSSINLVRCLDQDGSFRVRDFVHAVDIMILAQEIVVDNSSYPTEKVGSNTQVFRQLGLGYANIGALFMTLGIPYDSEEARHSAAAITALMTGEAYRYSSMVAQRMGAFAGFEANREPMSRVLDMHEGALDRVRQSRVFDKAIFEAAIKVWERTLSSAKKYGVRNSQVTLLAPTGTIAFMMDCATTGIEPEFALVKTKHLIGGGTMRLVNTTVPVTLKRLGYAPGDIDAIVTYMKDTGTIEGAPGLKDEHTPVFDCAVRPEKGKRSIAWHGHVRMVAAVQPFLSGAVSKTFNMPNETTVDEITEAYMMGWKLGLKAFAVYRDGSKAAQPLMVSGSNQGKPEEKKPTRRRLPQTRASETHKFSIAGHEGYLTYSMYEDGTLAELFIRMSKQGSTIAGLLDTLATSVSVALQYGMPLKSLASKFSYSRFEPSGITGNPNIQITTSIVDYIFRYLAMRFLTADELEEIGVQAAPKELDMAAIKVLVSANVANGSGSEYKEESKSEAPRRIYADTMCKVCGGMLVQTGSCRTCIQCGTSSGGC